MNTELSLEDFENGAMIGNALIKVKKYSSEEYQLFLEINGILIFRSWSRKIRNKKVRAQF